MPPAHHQGRKILVIFSNSENERRWSFMYDNERGKRHVASSTSGIHYHWNHSSHCGRRHRGCCEFVPPKAPIATPWLITKGAGCSRLIMC
jgi:hypothetical protein